MEVKKFLRALLTNRVTVVLFVVSLGIVLVFNSARSNQTDQEELRALAIAQATAAIPEVPILLENGDPTRELPVLGETIRKNTHASYVVIADIAGIRHSHPNPKLIGQKLDGPQYALKGRSYTTIDKGTLGISVNGKTPIRDANGKIVGMVSAGILQRNLSAADNFLLRKFLIYGFGFLFVGLVLAELIDRFFRSRSLHEELEAVTTQFQEREAMLHSIREGVITLSLDSRITLINDEAMRLLGLTSDVVGKKVKDIFPEGRIRNLISGTVSREDDLQVLTEYFSILVSRREVYDQNIPIGFVVTLRDRTEHIELLRELESVNNLTDALRSQQHEFANRIHTFSGLLELNRVEEAKIYLGEIAHLPSNLAEELSFKLANPLIVALLIAKVSISKERAVTLHINAKTSIDDLNINPNALVTILGNLIENAIDAASGTPKATVEVTFTAVDESFKRITVQDTGPGLPISDPTIIFQDGFSTKLSNGSGHRGLGLAIVKRLVQQSKGEIIVENSNGALFIVNLPILKPGEEKSWQE